MTNTLVRALLLAAAAAVVQIGVLAYSVHARAVILRDGAEVVLKTEPVDPRDLLRGRYVRLGYGISRLPKALFPEADRERLEGGAAVRVHLVAAADGLWIADAASLGARGDGADRTWIRGKVQFTSGDDHVMVEYGIERFYAAEYLAPEIEKNMRDGDVTHAVVAIGDNGTAQIKALRQDDQTLFTEPIY